VTPALEMSVIPSRPFDFLRSLRAGSDGEGPHTLVMSPQNGLGVIRVLV
jgi:hypothetical protein